MAGNLKANIWAICLENMLAPAPRNRMSLYILLQDSFNFPFCSLGKYEVHSSHACVTLACRVERYETLRNGDTEISKFKNL
jgi:hypothetical protein